MAWPPEPHPEPTHASPTRASDAERDLVLDKLGDGFAEGRLSHETFVLTLPDDTRRRVTIGRELTCDMPIGDQTVSRWHADLSRGPGGWRLVDLGSTNGTRLNGWRITGPVHVRPGDLVSFGMVTFVLGLPPGACVTGPQGYPIRA